MCHIIFYYEISGSNPIPIVIVEGKLTKYTKNTNCVYTVSIFFW